MQPCQQPLEEESEDNLYDLLRLVMEQPWTRVFDIHLAWWSFKSVTTSTAIWFAVFDFSLDSLLQVLANSDIATITTSSDSCANSLTHVDPRYPAATFGWFWHLQTCIRPEHVGTLAAGDRRSHASGLTWFWQSLVKTWAILAFGMSTRFKFSDFGKASVQAEMKSIEVCPE